MSSIVRGKLVSARTVFFKANLVTQIACVFFGKVNTQYSDVRKLFISCISLTNCSILCTRLQKNNKNICLLKNCQMQIRGFSRRRRLRHPCDTPSRGLAIAVYSGTPNSSQMSIYDGYCLTEWAQFAQRRSKYSVLLTCRMRPDQVLL